LGASKVPHRSARTMPPRAEMARQLAGLWLVNPGPAQAPIRLRFPSTMP
jgi:hypothetical protein